MFLGCKTESDSRVERNVYLQKEKAYRFMGICNKKGVPIVNTGADGDYKYVTVSVTSDEEEMLNRYLDRL